MIYMYIQCLFHSSKTCFSLRAYVQNVRLCTFYSVSRSTFLFVSQQCLCSTLQYISFTLFGYIVYIQYQRCLFFPIKLKCKQTEKQTSHYNQKLCLCCWPYPGQNYLGTVMTAHAFVYSNYSNFNQKQQNVTSPPSLPLRVSVDQPKQEKRSSFLVNYIKIIVW